ncbi:flavin monoamine oxidase family protein [Micromonospora sp. CPCC 206061]|uniref:flavin monoamine oxidase family protein n=1 Tax=Micromonospora sp. CPCC 206061 TaxID=3122410 RepID=UPI002FEF06AE
MSSQPSAQFEKHYDVVIVGAGVSGLYTAWRLLSGQPAKKPKPSVAIFEASDRVGGRLLTWNPAGPAGGLRAELGGMRFFEDQQLVWNLIHKGGIGLDRQVVPFFTDGSTGLIRYLRALHMPAADDSVAIKEKRYWLNSAEQRERYQKSVDYLKRVISDVLKRNNYRPDDLKTRKAWDEAKGKLKYDGRMLTDVGFWNLLSRELSSEAYKFITDSFGYYSLALNWNAAEAIQNISLEFADNPDYHTLAEGYESLPIALAAKVRELGGEIHLETPVLKFDLTSKQKGGPAAVTVRPAGVAAQNISADQLVLALPRRSLELLAPTPSFDWQHSPRLRWLLDSARPYPAFKLFLMYENRWWEDPDFVPQSKYGPIQHGRSVCDLPIRQTYYLRPDSCEKHGWKWANGPHHGLVMASYDDSVVVDFWRGMEPTSAEKAAQRDELRSELSQILSFFLPAGMKAAEDITWEPPPHMHKATPAMVEQAERQLRELHALPKDAALAKLLFAAYADWTVDPFGGGWHFWEPQYPVVDVMREIKTPLGKDKPVYLVGEAYSGVQGWVEGALTTAEVVLEEFFHLDRPSWLPANYYLGQ